MLLHGLLLVNQYLYHNKHYRILLHYGELIKNFQGKEIIELFNKVMVLEELLKELYKVYKRILWMLVMNYKLSIIYLQIKIKKYLLLLKVHRMELL